MSTVTHTGEWAGAVPYWGQDPVLDTWVVETAGEHTISWVLESPDDLVHARVVTPDGTATGDLAGYGIPSTATLTVTLNEGDIIEFRHVISINGWGGSGTGSWSITAPATLPPLPENAHYASSIVGVYVGDELAQALYHGSVLLWSSIVAVTPTAPTFHDGEPWITLPTVEGVTYSVSGTPGVGQSVTVTATAQAGYELVGESVWQHTFPLPVVTIISTDELGFESRSQFRQACIDHGTTYQTVETLPFLLDTSQSTILRFMFDGCSSLTQVPDLDTSQATNLSYMFRDCSSLTDGNVRCIGRHPDAYTNGMIARSGLTREPFYDINGNPI